ncbi:AsnC family transcriptional regulator [Hydrogenophaga crassostreae]|uniref:siroheme decarboxylase n=1 Tax=Hydrogenophaga crassostreae TaxID=1763535 RepID=A0A162T5H1_9BURK|nr:Lrp/AsnC family transcriptional regulator [Hydrogenophaga crassostreae]AOW14323.1 AsnC family transcriptional regulator [Hydrogenophaga crassostreae]OAD43655.1 AsnC family transcriptional regulator [Hydrogenophaga crassostreae]
MNARAPWPTAPSNTDMALLNEWQHGFPLVREPFLQIAQALSLNEAQVIGSFQQMQERGAISRIGGVFSPGAGGAALLAAMAVPADRLDAIAAQVSAHPGVNHNYEREHRFNLWFVMTGTDAHAVNAAMDGLERETGLPALRLRMERAYRIDLGFDLRHATAQAPMRVHRGGDTAALVGKDHLLAACVEQGLSITARPFDAWASACECSPEEIIDRLQRWVDAGTLKRFGVVVRHHELGFSANAMTVFNVPEDQVDACGELLAAQPGVTLAYKRERAQGWPFNLYCMVHGTHREAVHAVIERVIPAVGLTHYPREILFSTRRFKQTGARRFRSLPNAQEPAHALA